MASQLRAVASSDIKIDKHIPLPKTYGKRKYPFAQMDVGDSFFLPTQTSRNLLYALAKRDGAKVSVRAEGAGLRVWRIA